jgi:hypothetical protein
MSKTAKKLLYAASTYCAWPSNKAEMNKRAFELAVHIIAGTYSE